MVTETQTVMLRDRYNKSIEIRYRQKIPHQISQEGSIDFGCIKRF